MGTRINKEQMVDRKYPCLRVHKPSPGLEYVYWHDLLLAIILGADFQEDGIHFFTDDAFSQQLGYMNWPQGHEIAPHDHNAVPRQVEWTQETLFIRSGRVRVDFYAPENRAYLGSRELGSGDVVLLAHGGHGFKMLEPSRIVEVKQGPYAGTEDKTRFRPTDGPMAKGLAHE